MTDEEIVSKAMSNLAKRRWANTTPEERKALSKKANDAQTSEMRTASAYKAWETKRRKKSEASKV